MKTTLGNYSVLPDTGFKVFLSYLMIVVLWVVMIFSLSGCGLMTSQGHFEMAGDKQGIYAVSDMMNGLANARSETNGYWRQRKLQETEETARDAEPGFWSKVFFGGGMAGAGAKRSFDGN